MPSAEHEFPRYTPGERTADKVVHIVGLTSTTVALVWLLRHIGPEASAGTLAAVLIYGSGLLGMLSASALYNLTPTGPLKAWLRRLDHAMIFVMIAGSYTPFALVALPRGPGTALCALVWVLATAGAALKLLLPARWELPSLVLYLGMGWLVLAFLRPLMRVLPGTTLALLLLGGVLYSVGALLHGWGRMRFHNALWHGFVVIAAGLHLAAVARIVPGPG